MIEGWKYLWANFTHRVRYKEGQGHSQSKDEKGKNKKEKEEYMLGGGVTETSIFGLKAESGRVQASLSLDVSPQPMRIQLSFEPLALSPLSLSHQQHKSYQKQ